MSEIPVRQGVQHKEQIVRALEQSFAALADWIEDQPDAAFAAGPAGRWSMGQHLDHLIRSVEPINMGMMLPKWLLGIALGTANRPSMTYAELAARYEGALSAGGKAMGRYLPPSVPLSRKAALLARYRAHGARLCARLNSWSEDDLDHYIAKHPLIGILTMRELLFFTAHHIDHHLHTLQRDYAGH